MDLRYRLHCDLIGALEVIETVDRAYGSAFGREWGGLFWTYRMDDAAYAVVSMGSLALECTLAVDELRRNGIPVGVVGVRTYRPFPWEALSRTLAERKTVIVVEKNVSYGYRGALATDLKAALFDAGLRPGFASFVAGLGGRDVRSEELVQVVRSVISGAPTSGWLNIRV